MKKTQKEYVSFIQKTIDKWSPKLLVQSYCISIEKSKEKKYLASRYRYPYMEGVILWTDASFESWKEGDTNHERRIVHELVHIFTDPFYTKAVERYLTKESLEDERERLTDLIANIVFKLDK